MRFEDDDDGSSTTATMSATTTMFVCVLVLRALERFICLTAIERYSGGKEMYCYRWLTNKRSTIYELVFVPSSCLSAAWMFF